MNPAPSITISLIMGRRSTMLQCAVFLPSFVLLLRARLMVVCLPLLASEIRGEAMAAHDTYRQQPMFVRRW
jgi:hypothetical protein